MKNYQLAIPVLFATFLNLKVLNPFEYSIQTEKMRSEAILSELQSGNLPIFKWLNLIQAEGQFANAQSSDSSCDALTTTARTTCASAWSDYAHGALKYFNGTLCRFNKESTAEVDNILCHFRKSMGIKVDLAALPLTATKTFNSKTVSVSIVTPTEAFATSAGYQAKGTVTVNGSTYMVLYWGGSGSSTKGFMIEGNGSGGIGEKRANYVTWDLTTSTAQSVKMYSTSFPSGTFLTTASKTGSSYRGDSAVYGQVTFNATTKAVSTQVVILEEQRSGGTAGQFGCFRMYSTGIKDASVTITKTKDSFSGSGHATNSSSRKLDDMDGIVLTDSKTTPNFTGTAITTQSGLETALGVGTNADVFAVSCNTLFTAGSASNIFSTATSFVDFTKTLSSVFP
jgi:hypothetical protein